MTRHRFVCTALAALAGPFAISVQAQQVGCGTAQAPDCDCDGNTDPQIPSPIILQDDGVGIIDVSFTNVVTRDVVQNDGYSGRIYDGNGPNPLVPGTIRVITGPRHGSDSRVQIPHPTYAPDEYHGVRCNWSLDDDYFDLFDGISYELIDQCGNHSANVGAFFYRVTDTSASNSVLSLAAPVGGQPNWIQAEDGFNLDQTVTALTIEFWVRPAQLGTPVIVVSKWADFDGVNPLAQRSYSVGIESDGAVQFSLSDTAHQNDSSYHEFRAGALQAGVWQHVACTFDGIDRRIYINGELVGIKNAPGTIHVGTGHLSIGIHVRNLDFQNPVVDASSAFVGRLDSLRIWKIARPQYQLRSDRWSRHSPNAGSGPENCIATFDFEFSSQPGYPFLNLSTHGVLNFLTADYGGLQMIDCNGNGQPDDRELELRGLAIDADGNFIIDACEVRTFCAGDGTGGVCPCANYGAVGHGCRSSLFASGGLLSKIGNARVSADTVVLQVSNVTGTTCFLFQGDAEQPPLVVGDGLGCVSGSIVRFATQPVVGNASSYPGPGDPLVSVRGQLPVVGGTRYYQAFYRNVQAAFCPPGTSNRTNGVALTWSP